MISIPHRLLKRTRDERGFTLIELLVVIVIVGVLAAIAIPSLIGQRSKASDASAKTQARTLQTAAEAAASDESGSYKSASLERLEQIEPTLKDHTVNVPKVEKHTEKEFEVASENVTTGNVYTIKRNANGEVTRPCTVKKTGGCPAGGSW